MKTVRRAAALAASVALCLVSLSAAERDDSSASHVAAAKSAARDDWAGLFARTCGSLNTPPGGRGTAAGAQATLARDNWHAEPVKVFDNR